MNKNNADILLTKVSKDKEFIDLIFKLELHEEDYRMLGTIHEASKKSINPNLGLADTLLNVLTYGIHQLWQDVTGEKYEYRIDRRKA